MVAVLALVAANAFFVVGDYAVVTARRASFARAAQRGSRRAAAVLRLMDDPVRVISTVQVGITAIGILTGAIGEPLVNDLLGDALPAWANFLIAFGIVTYLSVVVGELVPKALTLHSAERLAMLVARPIELIGVALRPVVWVLQGSARLVLRPFGVREVVAGETSAQEELIYNVFDFASREAADVMVPGPDVVWPDASLAAGDALDRVIEIPHRRIPVGEGTLDRLAGIVHLQDLVRAARREPVTTVGELTREPLIVPKTKDLGALLRERREEMAVVVSEYGGTSGIVTLEDILEEIVGDIESEYELPGGDPDLDRRAHRGGCGLDVGRRLQRGDRRRATAGRRPHARRPGLRHARARPGRGRCRRADRRGPPRRRDRRRAHHPAPGRDGGPPALGSTPWSSAR